jgi:hypothetical protein
MTDEDVDHLAAARADMEKAQAALDAKLTRLEAQVARDEETLRQSRIPRMQPDAPPANATDLLAVREAEFKRLVADPASSQPERHRAFVLLDRARLAAETEQKQTALAGQMARSAALRHDAEQARLATEAKRKRERDAHEQAAKDEKWRDAVRRKFVNG